MSDEAYTKHAIQLIDLKVLNLNIQANLDVDQTMPSEGNFRFVTGLKEYDAEKKLVMVKIGVEMGSGVADEGEHCPFDLEVELLGVFDVDDSRFPMEFINDWAQKNAPLVLYPYLREHVHGLTSRAGFGNMLLPLFEVPTFKI